MRARGAGAGHARRPRIRWPAKLSVHIFRMHACKPQNSKEVVVAKMSKTSVLVGLLVLLCASCIASIEVPKEWIEAIRALCSDAEKGIFPHLSPHAQMLQGRIQRGVQPQVRYLVRHF